MGNDTGSLFDLTGRVAIVTGGSRGLGRAISLGYAAAGAKVVIASRKQENCEALAREIEAAGGEALPVATHVGKVEELERLVDTTVATFGRLDILVNNAANPLGGMLTEVTELAFEKSYAVNVKGPLFLSARAVDHLAASGHGVIVNVITAGAFNPGESLGLYCSGKAALWNLTKVMAKEWAPRGVRVNALAPGPFATDMMAATYEVPEFRDAIVASTLLKRIADPEEIVGAALFLASDASSYMTGSVLPIDGGIMA
ncbi:SDR family NAD(P)-dependent oxidoreductase [Rhabdothermincola sp.]|uniref:SDR family NAD(P)-dependent oxidoreductase n=1 Tax=Rhabdothermincola sp. TaxID=2820405 RepID=UPI002FE00359